MIIKTLWFRIFLLLLTIAMAIFATYIIAPFSDKFFRKYCCKYLAKWCLLSTGAKLNVYGEDISKIDLANTLVISNHISFLEVLCVSSIIPVQYVAKIEMSNWYIFNTLVKKAGVIFIDRQRKKSLAMLNNKIFELLSHGATIGLFPEGNFSNGEKIIPFKPALFESAIMAKSKILPIVFSYRKGNDEIATEISFVGATGVQMFFNVFKIKDLRINLTILPAVDSTQFTNRVELANYVYKQSSHCYLRKPF